eukprot:scaffold20252_cov135-Isochrysis_galbana.AAC.2
MVARPRGALASGHAAGLLRRKCPSWASRQDCHEWAAQRIGDHQDAPIREPSLGRGPPSLRQGLNASRIRPRCFHTLVE